MQNQPATVINILMVSEQLALIDNIEKILKSRYIVNTHISNQVIEITGILEHEKLNLIIIDNDPNTTNVGNIKNIVKQLGQSVPILQLQELSQSPANYYNSGASLVCPISDRTAIQKSAQLLIDYGSSNNSSNQAADGSEINYENKFNDLYPSILDPVCYVQDGMFIDCNPSFLQALEITDKKDLANFTILDFIDPQDVPALKKFLRKAEKKKLSGTTETFSLKTQQGKVSGFSIMAQPATFGPERAIQLYLRSSESGGGGSISTSSYDETTGLGGKEQIHTFITQQVKHLIPSRNHASVLYILLGNYRDVWANDQKAEAEKLMSAVAKVIRQHLPVHSEIARYTDDGLVAYIPKLDIQQTKALFEPLPQILDELIPEGMVRMVEPTCFMAIREIQKNEDPEEIISQLFKTARSMSVSETQSIIAESTSTEIAKKDIKRLDLLKNTLNKSAFGLNFQPIANFTPDAIERYEIQLTVPTIDEVEDDLESLKTLAEKYSLMHKIDEWTITKLLDLVLTIEESKRPALRLYIPVSMDSLKQPKFASWLTTQLKHTGLDGHNFIFQMATDNIKQAYHGARQFSQKMHEYGAYTAVTHISRISGDDERMIDELTPNVIKLDVREIDTLESHEEREVMEDICDKAKALNATIIADYLTSPSQLSRIWPYDISLIQGKGMTPILQEMNYDFNSFSI